MNKDVVVGSVAVYVAGVSAYHHSLRQEGGILKRSMVPLGILVSGVLLIAVVFLWMP